MKFKKFLLPSILFVSTSFVLSGTSQVIKAEEVLDLELVSKNNGQPGGLSDALCKTITKNGSDEFCKIIKNPLTEEIPLQARQKLIAQFDNEEYRNSVTAQLTIIKKHEQVVKEYFATTNKEFVKTALKKSFYRMGMLQNLNDSAIALDIAHFFEFCSLFGPLIEHLMLHFALGYVNQLLDHKDDHHGHGHKAHKHKKHDHNCVNCLLEHDSKGSFWKNSLFTALKIGHFTFHLFNIKEMFEHLLNKADIINVVHQSVISTYACIQAAARIGELVDKQLLAASGLNTESLSFLYQKNPKLLEQSFDENFKDESSNSLHLFSRVGPTLASHTFLQNKSEFIIQLLESAGKIDALMSINTLMRENPSHYSYALYVQDTTPYIELENFVHPQLLQVDKKTTPNSIVLSKENKTLKVIITGPNKSGKSSTAKAVATNLVLMQTFGIAAATKAIATLMHRIITYINIHDDLSVNHSTFLAEIIRADSTLQELRTLSGKAPALALFDDSFLKSTQFEEGDAAATRFFEKIAPLDVSVLLITHSAALSNLPEKTSGDFCNFFIGLVQDKDNQYSSTYTLQQGVSPRDAIFKLVGNSPFQAEFLN